MRLFTRFTKPQAIASVAFTIAVCLQLTPATSESDPSTHALLGVLPAEEQQYVQILSRNDSQSAPLYHAENGAVLSGSKTVAVDASDDIYADPASGNYVATYNMPRPVQPPPGPQASTNSLGTPVLQQYQAPFDIRTGALHGTRGRNGLSSEEAIVSIPCNVAKFELGWGKNYKTGQYGMVDQETGYIYLGGWGAGEATPVNVDAGLQKSSQQNAPDDNYAAYFKYGGNRPVTFNTRFPCGPNATVDLLFYPVSDTLLRFSATGTIADGRRVTMTFLQQTNYADGWWPNGGSANDGIILKRLISIAQPPSWHTPGRGYRRSGAWRHDSYFGVDASGSRVPKIRWLVCKIGRGRNLHSWRASDTWTPPPTSPKKIFLNYPTGATVLLPPSSHECDAAAINLNYSQIP